MELETDTQVYKGENHIYENHWSVQIDYKILDWNRSEELEHSIATIKHFYPNSPLYIRRTVHHRYFCVHDQITLHDIRTPYRMLFKTYKGLLIPNVESAVSL
jgi:hypothetical protein